MVPGRKNILQTTRAPTKKREKGRKKGEKEEK
jgi:hypothetical protein